MHYLSHKLLVHRYRSTIQLVVTCELYVCVSKCRPYTSIIQIHHCDHFYLNFPATMP